MEKEEAYFCFSSSDHMKLKRKRTFLVCGVVGNINQTKPSLSQLRKNPPDLKCWFTVLTKQYV